MYGKSNPNILDDLKKAHLQQKSQPSEPAGPESKSGETYGLVISLSPPGLIDSNVLAPSLDEKKAPHLGHLNMVSFDTDAHPKEKQMTIDIIMYIFIFAFVGSPR
jgi:hypothetical protein